MCIFAYLHVNMPQATCKYTSLKSNDKSLHDINEWCYANPAAVGSLWPLKQKMQILQQFRCFRTFSPIYRKQIRKKATEIKQIQTQPSIMWLMLIANTYAQETSTSYSSIGIQSMCRYDLHIARDIYINLGILTCTNQMGPIRSMTSSN